jgi:hypothetical protein
MTQSPEYLTQSAEDTSYLSQTRGLTRQGKYEEALKRFLWFDRQIYDSASEMNGVRRSFALSYWKELANRYQPALDSMLEIRDSKTTKVLSDGGTCALFADVVAINRTVEENSKSISLFETLLIKFPDQAKSCHVYIIGDLLNSKRYDLMKGVVDPIAVFKRTVKFHNKSLAELGEYEEEVNEYRKKIFSLNAKQLIDYCLAIGDQSSADYIRFEAYLISKDRQFKDP